MCFLSSLEWPSIAVVCIKFYMTTVPYILYTPNFLLYINIILYIEHVLANSGVNTLTAKISCLYLSLRDRSGHLRYIDYAIMYNLFSVKYYSSFKFQVSSYLPLITSDEPGH